MNAQTPNLLWAKQFGGTGVNTVGNSSVLDASGNIYTTGSFKGSVKFDSILTSHGGKDIFISKLDPSGKIVWAKQIGGVQDDEGFSICSDKGRNIFITGYFFDTVDFDPGPGVGRLVSAIGYPSIFILKLDTSGNFVWAKQVGSNGLGNGEYDIGTSIAVDAQGNVLTTGNFYNIADFDPGPDTFIMTTGSFPEPFVLKLDATGNLVWAKKFDAAQGVGGGGATSIAVDANGNVFTTGSFFDTVDFDPGKDTSYLVSGVDGGTSDIFISKLDAFGNFVWARQLGGSDDETASAIALDKYGNIYTTGFFNYTVDFDPGKAIFNLVSKGNKDAFVSKLDADGKFVWAKQIGGVYDQQGLTLTVDTLQNVYVGGWFNGEADFDPSDTGVFTMNAPLADIDNFIVKLDISGNLLWAMQLGGSNTASYGHSLALDNNGNIYNTGSFSGTVDFAPDSTINNLASLGYNDFFIAKFGLGKTNASFAVIDPSPTFIDAQGLINIPDNSKIDLTKTMEGAAADGVTKLLLITKSKVPVTFSLSGSKDGGLSNLNNQNVFSSSVTVSPINDSMVIAIYSVPDGYGTDNPNGGRIVSIQATSSSSATTVALKLVTPPVVLVHGMWSSPTAWTDGGFVNTLSTAGYSMFYNQNTPPSIYLADFSAHSASTFDPESSSSIYGRTAVQNEIDNAIKNYRNKNIAISQVDVVGHSLGGLMARSYSQQKPFINDSNYYKGYIHKLITLGTPHRGSPLGPELWNDQDNIVELPVPIGGDVIVVPVPLRNLMSFFGDPIDMVHRDFAKDSKGITDLTQTLPYHTYSITGNYSSNPKGLSELAAYYGLDALLLWATGKTHAQIFTADPCTTEPNTDLIVEVNSQTGGIGQSQNFLGVAHSIPGFVTETNDSTIQKRVLELLLSDDTNLFGSGFPSPANIASDCVNGTNSIVQSSKGKTGSLSAAPVHIVRPLGANSYVQITSPSKGAFYQENSGAAITLQFNANNVVPVDSPLFIINGVGWFFAPAQPPYSVSFTMPNNTSVGRLGVSLLVKDTSGRLYADTSTIFINPVGILDSIACDPIYIRFDSAYRETSLHVEGYFNNGAGPNTVDLSNASTGTTYSSFGAPILSVSPDGIVTALASGSDTLTITNGGHTSKIRVTVDSNFSYAVKYANRIEFPTMSGPFYQQQPFGLFAYSTSGDTIHYTLVSGPATLQNGVLTITGPGKITVMASDAGNVYFAAADNVTRTFCFSNFLASPISGDTVTCAVSKTYTVSKLDGATYQWGISEGGEMVASDTSAEITWNEGGMHTITVTPIVDGCSGISQTLKVNVTGSIKPVITQLNRSLISSSGSGNQWYFNNAIIQGATDSVYNPTASGSYSVQATQNGCTGPLSDPFVVVLSNNLDSNVQIFPNPVSKILNVNNIGSSPIQIQLFDMMGRRIITIDNISGKYKIATAQLSAGCYVVFITDDITKNKTRKLILKL